MRVVWWLVLLVVLGVLAAGAAAMVVPDLRWRTDLLVAKARGGYPEASWEEFLRMLRPGSGIWLEKLATRGSLYPVVNNPHRSPEDLEAGQRLYADACARCHGGAGEGGVGPALKDSRSPRLESDWALFRVVRYGIPGTAMIGQPTDWLRTWRIAAYVRSLAGEGAGGPEALPELLAGYGPVTPARLLAADDTPGDWLTYGGNYSSHRFSLLRRITAANVRDLRVKWIYQPLTDSRRIETTPLVANGVMFVTFPPASVAALDARTGRELWRHLGRIPADFPRGSGIFEVNRGPAVLDDKVFIATLDTHVKALDARTGKVLWDTTVGDYRQAITFTSAPLVARGMVVVGTAGGDFPTRGYIVGLDAATGEERWRFYTIPAEGEPGNETWEGDSWKVGGAAPWMTGSFDPALNLVYWGVGNPAPDHRGDEREGDNLYSCAVLALDITTGKLAWHFQFTPHDLHDWDATQVPVLSPPDGASPGRVWIANRSGFFFALARDTGKLLSASPFVKQTWSKAFGPDGRPLRDKSAEPTAEGTIVYPSAVGGTNWWPPAFNPGTGLFYVPFMEQGAVFYESPQAEPEPARLFMLGSSEGLGKEPLVTGVRAIDPADGRVVWSHENEPRNVDAETSGLMTTAGGLVFGADQATMFALDARTGERLWEFPVGDKIATAPMSYAVDGEQFVASAAGGIILGFALGEGVEDQRPVGAVPGVVAGGREVPGAGGGER
jgi:alcohol dehydrogenase (cytochrome c)